MTLYILPSKPFEYLLTHCILIFRYNFVKYNVFLSLTVVLILANSVDPDEMQHNEISTCFVNVNSSIRF